ncbi:MAG: nickel pincer cofactor biosynthesis protein LarC [Planctomycetota bacterium]|jgi:uncharacterized protein (TIGR00299 family) protein
MKTGYFDCFAGAAGDMIAGAMLDAGLDEEFLAAQLRSLQIEGLDIKISQTKRCGISALQFVPAAPGRQERHLPDITELIGASRVAESAKARAISIFEALAKAEASIHGTSPSQVHFHEIGAVDSIVDIVSACVGLETLGIEKVYCSAVAVGGGVVQTAHGLLPVPAPATAKLLKEAEIPVTAGAGTGELLTPTGAAILGNFVDEFAPLPDMKIESVGYGAGSRESDEFPNVLRLIIGEMADDQAQTDCVCLLEANIDDATGEVIGFLIERVLEEGAIDVFTTAIGMKQCRPGVKLSVICSPADGGKMQRILFEEGLTLGIRRQLLQRSKLAREFVTVETEFGPIRVKTGIVNGKVVSAKPEYSDCAAAAKRHEVGLKIIQASVMKIFYAKD